VENLQLCRKIATSWPPLLTQDAADGSQRIMFTNRLFQFRSQSTKTCLCCECIRGSFFSKVMIYFIFMQCQYNINSFFERTRFGYWTLHVRSSDHGRAIPAEILGC